MKKNRRVISLIGIAVLVLAAAVLIGVWVKSLQSRTPSGETALAGDETVEDAGHVLESEDGGLTAVVTEDGTGDNVTDASGSWENRQPANDSGASPQSGAGQGGAQETGQGQTADGDDTGASETPDGGALAGDQTVADDTEWGKMF